MPMSIVRRTARDTLFATVIQPATDDAPAAMEWLKTDDTVAAVRLQLETGDALVVYNGTGAPIEIDGLSVPGRLAARLTAADGATSVHTLD
jgi:hypothetical protein